MRLIRHGIPVILTSHSAFEKHRPLRIKIFDVTLCRVIFDQTAKVIALTNSEKEYLMYLGCKAEKISIISDGAKSYFLSRPHNLAKFRLKYKIK